jgi:hypothetical protein
LVFRIFQKQRQQVKLFLICELSEKFSFAAGSRREYCLRHLDVISLVNFFAKSFVINALLKGSH